MLNTEAYKGAISDPVLLFGTLLALFLLAPLLFRQIRLPGVIGLIVAGVTFGPNGLGWISLDGAVEVLGRVGLLYIMFIAGLEINLQEFSRHKNRSIVFGALTFFIPQIAGTVIFLGLGFSWLASILIASMFASHTLVAYPIISRLGITKNNAVVTTVGGTLLTDTAALLVLAIVAKSFQGELNAAFWTGLAVWGSLYVAGMWFVLPRLGRWFMRRVSDGASEFLFVLATAFLASYLARKIGIEPIVGAFLAGLVLNRLVPETSVLMSRIQFVGNALFIPFFLLFIGMLVDLQVLLGDLRTWGIMAAMLSTNVLTKLISSKITQRIYKYTPAEGWVIFGLSTTEAAATLAATLVGYELGIIGDDVLNGVILMILVTCILGSWVTEHFGRQVAQQAKTEPPDMTTIPQRILVPLANPETAPRLMDLALMLRSEPDTPLYPITVIQSSDSQERHVARGEELLELATRHAASAQVVVYPAARIESNIALGIVQAAKERMSTEILIGWNGHLSAGDRIFGSVLDQLLEESTHQVWVCKTDFPWNTHQRIVLCIAPYSGVEAGFTGLIRSLASLRSQLGAEVHVLAESSRVDYLKGVMEKTRPAFDPTFHALTEWDDVLHALEKMVRNDDLIFLVSARKETTSWRPGLDRLPRQLVERFPANACIVAYPSIPPEGLIRRDALEI